MAQPQSRKKTPLNIKSCSVSIHSVKILWQFDFIFFQHELPKLLLIPNFFGTPCNKLFHSCIYAPWYSSAQACGCGKKFTDALRFLLDPNYCPNHSIFLCVSKGLVAPEPHKQIEMILLFVVNKTKEENIRVEGQHVGKCWWLHSNLLLLKTPYWLLGPQSHSPDTVYACGQWLT